MTLAGFSRRSAAVLLTLVTLVACKKGDSEKAGDSGSSATASAAAPAKAVDPAKLDATIDSLIAQLGSSPTAEIDLAKLGKPAVVKLSAFMVTSRVQSRAGGAAHV